MKGAATGAIRGVSNAVGFVGNLQGMADYLTAGGEHLFTGEAIPDIVAREKANRAAIDGTGLSKYLNPNNVFPSGEDVSAPILAKTGAYNPTSEWGRVGQAGVEAATGAFGPGIGSAAKGATALGLLAGAVRTAPANFISGAAAQGVTDATGSPLAGMAAGLVAPGAAETIGSAAARYGRDLPGVGQFAQSVDDTRIGRKLLGMALDPAAVQATVNPTDLSSNPSSSAIPGFEPTTGQLTGDLGLLRAENPMKTGNNTPLTIRAEQQNTAAQKALASISPNGDAMQPSTVFQQHLNAVDQASQLALDRITAGAQTLAAPLGQALTPEDIGTTIRSSAMGASQRAQEVRRGLYQAVDQYGTLGMPTSTVSSAAKNIVDWVGRYSHPISPDEARLYGLAQRMPGVVPYSDLVDFDQNLNCALPDAMGASKARLRQLKSAVMDRLNGTADDVGQQEAQQIAAGTRAPDDTVANRVQQAFQQSAAATPPSLESRVMQNAVPAAAGHTVVPVDVAKVNQLWKLDPS